MIILNIAPLSHSSTGTSQVREEGSTDFTIPSNLSLHLFIRTWSEYSWGSPSSMPPQTPRRRTVGRQVLEGELCQRQRWLRSKGPTRCLTAWNAPAGRGRGRSRWRRESASKYASKDVRTRRWRQICLPWGNGLGSPASRPGWRPCSRFGCSSTAYKLLLQVGFGKQVPLDIQETWWMNAVL